MRFNITRFARVTIFLTSAVILSSCGSLPSLNESAPDSVVASVGTGGQLINILSDNVSRAGYNDETGVMTVQFENGALYEYYDVESSLWVDFLAAQPHPWSQIGYPRLVQDGVPYKRIG